ncbi:hypothetical protein KJ596_03645 [Patescibacteria group bacterium]|nr:hypothetical protein [Patescibacteria group bacterium]
MNKEKNKQIFSTDNFPLAIFLKVKACNLLGLSKKSARRSFFNFEDTPLRKQLTKDFWEEKGVVEPRAFCQTQKELKTILYDDSYPAF